MKTTRRAGGNLPKTVTTVFLDECVKEITGEKVRSAYRLTRVRPRCRLINAVGQAEILKFRVDRIGALSSIRPKRCGREREGATSRYHRSRHRSSSDHPKPGGH